MTLNTPYIEDQVYTIGDYPKEWTYDKFFATMAPLCPYTLSFSFSSSLPAFVVETPGTTTKLTALSLDRSDATIALVDVTATVVEQPASEDVKTITDQFEF